MKILSIDDDRYVLRALARMFVNEGHEAVTVTSIQSAMEAIEKHKSFDCITCDMMMLGETGLDFLKQMEQKHLALSRKIVFCTGGGLTPETEQFLDAPTRPVLSKPFGIQDLKAIING